ncbi:NUDIX hydrolase [Aeromicrobium sp. A1-2]|uniref:NUDIX hydrolase n=1 Tax=Aeromicrobium sp. A1-2 TaxID=2107713 RepID=UPI000E4D5E55|nr:NUDIX hydrolase [Aeromicrobium sp. A1-2]AXT86245.1 NUDIX hydrolase [Aeromicrobium sp. A1-2]
MPLPEALRSHVGREDEAAAPRDAATVVVVRDGEHGIEAYLLRRQQSMAFAPRMYVFPGGGVDDPDRFTDVPWAGPTPDVWAERLGCSEDIARGLVCAAVRETFEECGVLLAGPDEHSVVADTSGARFQDARLALEAHELTFGAYLAESGLVLRADLLGAWAHWITPTFEPRRYDTRFFVAVLPAGQAVGALAREADHATWAPLRDVLAAVDGGEAAMLPPTHVTCRDIAGLRTDQVLGAAAERRIHPIEPRLVEVEGELFLETDLGEFA